MTLSFSNIVYTYPYTYPRVSYHILMFLCLNKMALNILIMKYVILMLCVKVESEAKALQVVKIVKISESEKSKNQVKSKIQLDLNAIQLISLDESVKDVPVVVVSIAGDYRKEKIIYFEFLFTLFTVRLSG